MVEAATFCVVLGAEEVRLCVVEVCFSVDSEPYDVS